MYDILFQPVNTLLSIKPVTEKALKRIGINNVRDLVFYKPYSYKLLNVNPNISTAKDGLETVITVKVDDLQVPRFRGKGPTKIFVSNETGNLVLSFFNKIPPFIFDRIKEGATLHVAGKIQYYRNECQMSHPDFILRKELITPLEPIYHLTYGLLNKQLSTYIKDAIVSLTASIQARINFGNTMSSESLPVIFLQEKEYMLKMLELIKKQHLIDIPPSAFEAEKALSDASAELAEFELFANQVSLRKLKTAKNENFGTGYKIFKSKQEIVLKTLGFELTQGQANAIKEIEEDQQSERQMMRLLQGDVGSGKTLVALQTMLNVVLSGKQAVMMAPTDLLSTQHYDFFQNTLSLTDIKITDNDELSGQRPLKVAILTGKTTAKERRKIQESLNNGKIDILIGTHALFQDKVEYSKLGYVIIDEQHRFGVEQRLELIGKASHPDVLVMTATPIPRSLTLTMFGDMNVSSIKTKPKNRLPIITTANSVSKLETVIGSLESKLADGEKVYWVCPLIDQSDKLEDNATDSDENIVYADVLSRAADLEAKYPGKVGILHGKIKGSEKDAIMQSFKDGKIRILVATTVIEVGIDVPDATLIIIENAEKFGLAQLHQLRGRVGRGALQSHCLLLYNPKRFSKMGRKRLEIMRESNDGFYLAEQDLILRGGGEILGTKQSGEPEFYFADLKEHLQILVRANKLADTVPENDFIRFQIKLFQLDRESLAGSG